MCTAAVPRPGTWQVQSSLPLLGSPRGASALSYSLSCFPPPTRWVSLSTFQMNVWEFRDAAQGCPAYPRCIQGLCHLPASPEGALGSPCSKLSPQKHPQEVAPSSFGVTGAKCAMTPRQRKSITSSFHHHIKEEVYRQEKLLMEMGVSMSRVI